MTRRKPATRSLRQFLLLRPITCRGNTLRDNPVFDAHRERGSRMSEDKAIVFVVDDDPSMRRSLESLLRSVGHDVRLFSSALPEKIAPRPPLFSFGLGLSI